jgi:hypothetical protein
MSRLRGNRYAALALVTFSLACGGDAPTAPNAAQETVLVSLVGLGSTDAGIVLQLIGAVSQIEAAGASLDVAWAADGPSSTTVVVVGPLSESVDVLVVRRAGGLEPLRAVVRELADAEGTVAFGASAQAIVRRVTP